MTDWRIIDEEFFLDYFKGSELKKIEFPLFWKSSYAYKNDFYEAIHKTAIDFVKQTNRGENLLSDERICELWHAHCDFCTKTITTHDDCTCYCTPDYQTWICNTCYDDFKTRFNWKIK